MSRHEFIGLLREALQDEIPQSAIEENVRFYNRYIEDELAKGRSEEDVFAELGDPRLIAKTITETWQSDDTSLDDDGDSRSGFGGGGFASDSYEENGRRSENYGGPYVNINGKQVNMNKWYMKVIPILIVILILLFVFWVMFGILHLTFSILTSPVFWVVVAVLCIAGFFSKRR